MWSNITKRPLVICAVIFCLGIATASQIKAHFLLVYLPALVCLFLGLLFLKKRARFDIFFCCLVFLLASSHLKNIQTLPRHHILKFISYQDSRPYLIKGYINSQPLFKNNRTSFVFRAQEIQSANLKYDTCGNILVQLKGKKDLSYGEGLIVQGNLYRPFRSHKHRQPGYRDYLSHRGIFCLMHVKQAGAVARLNDHKGLFLKRLAFWLRERIGGIVSSYLSAAPASILKAVVLGEKKNIPPVIYNSMVKSGTVHLLVVSGFHVGIVAFITVLFLRLIRIPRRLRFYIAIPVLALYCLMTGASTPAVRATIMAGVFMFAYLIRREADIYNSLSLAAIFILGANPRQLFDIGFQLSFASIISIVYLYPRIKLLLRVDRLKIRYIRFLIEGCLVSLSAWLGTLGFIVYYFRIISAVAVLANMFIVPLASLMTLCGFSLIAMDLICPFLAPFFGYSAEFIITVLLRINAFFIKLPGAYFSLA